MPTAPDNHDYAERIRNGCRVGFRSCGNVAGQARMGWLVKVHRSRIHRQNRPRSRPQRQRQMLFDKLDELINALLR